LKQLADLADPYLRQRIFHEGRRLFDTSYPFISNIQMIYLDISIPSDIPLDSVLLLISKGFSLSNWAVGVSTVNSLLAGLR